MRSIEWFMLPMTLGDPLSTLNHLNFYILHCLIHLRNWRLQRLQILCKGWMCKSQPTDDKLSLTGAWQVMWPIRKFCGSNHIIGTAEQGHLSPHRPWCIPPKMAGWVPPKFLIIMNLILGPAIVSSLLLYLLLYFFLCIGVRSAMPYLQ